jgi:cytochrome c553
MVKSRIIITLAILSVASTATFAKDTRPCTKIVDPGASAREGRRLFLESGCMSCHAISGKGGTTAPDLSGIGSRRNKAFIEAQIRDPQAHPTLKIEKGKKKPKTKTPKSKMVQADLFDDQIKSIADYLSTLREPTSSGNK